MRLYLIENIFNFSKNSRFYCVSVVRSFASSIYRSNGAHCSREGVLVGHLSLKHLSIVVPVNFLFSSKNASREYLGRSCTFFFSSLMVLQQCKICLRKSPKCSIEIATTLSHYLFFILWQRNNSILIRKTVNTWFYMLKAN